MLTLNEALKIAGLPQRTDEKMDDEFCGKLDKKSKGADEVEHDGKKYRRAGPKNAEGTPGKWKQVK